MTTARRAAVGLTLAGLTICTAAAANAGDFNPPYAPYPYGASGYENPYGAHGPCRILFERRVDPYGRPVEHRIRVCDEGAVPVTPGWTAAPTQYGYPPPQYYTPVPVPVPVPSGYDPYLRPPAPIVGAGY
jgi:hypothetical protein